MANRFTELLDNDNIVDGVNTFQQQVSDELDNIDGFRGAKLNAPDVQMIADGVATAVLFPEEVIYDSSENPVFDSSGFYNPAQPTRLTVPAGLSGYYSIIGRVHFSADATNRTRRTIRLNRNGAGGNYTAFPVEAGDQIKFEYSTVLHLNAGDYIELFVDPGVEYDAEIYDSQLMIDFRGK
jgi:hypothetical protein